MHKLVTAVAFALSITGAALSLAQAEAPMINGQVQKIDESTSKITLRHDAIPNLDMDSMTMVFRVKDPAMLKSVKVGDKVRFEADRIDGTITVIKIEKAK